MSFEYILLLTKGGPFYDTTVYALYVYKAGCGQYGYGAALSPFLIVIGVGASPMLGWRFFDMQRLLQRPRIEVQ